MFQSRLGRQGTVPGSRTGPCEGTVPVFQNAQKTYKQVISSITMDGLWQLLSWLLGQCTFVIALSPTQGQGRCLGVLHHDDNPKDNDYINVDIRVMGRTVLLGWIQLL